MSELIERLIRESSYPQYTPDGKVWGETVSLHKFADLIVKECVDEMLQQMWNYGIDESNNPSFYKAVEKTKEHFGVE